MKTSNASGPLPKSKRYSDKEILKRTKELSGFLADLVGYDGNIEARIGKLKKGEEPTQARVTVNPKYKYAQIEFFPEYLEDLDETILHEFLHLTQEEFFFVADMMEESISDSVAKKMFEEVLDMAMERQLVLLEQMIKLIKKDPKCLKSLQLN